jgi:hypothetical protein
MGHPLLKPERRLAFFLGVVGLLSILASRAWHFLLRFIDVPAIHPYPRYQPATIWKGDNDFD